MKVSFATLLCLGLFVSLTFGSDFRTYLATPDPLKSEFATIAAAKYLLVTAAWIIATAFTKAQPGARRGREIDNQN